MKGKLLVLLLLLLFCFFLPSVLCFTKNVVEGDFGQNGRAVLVGGRISDICIGVNVRLNGINRESCLETKLAGI